ncbi:MAG: DEAD/DEAH box helicase [Sandaracinaceae bacterium]|nr:DEAD/DEAH box helicase [Sandaracinaceae bacterium]
MLDLPRSNDAAIALATPHEASTLEARSRLEERARRRFGGLDAAPLVTLTLRAAEGADYPVAVAALDALARRYAFAQRDELRILARPRAAEVAHRVGREGRGGRTYEVWLSSTDPIETSCSCADFARSSLGLCKHGMVVLESVAGKRARPARARQGTLLRWDPRHPLGLSAVRGDGTIDATRAFDRAARLRVDGPCRIRGLVAGAPSTVALRDPKARAALLVALERAIEAGRLEAEPAARTIVHEELARARRLVEAARVRPACRSALRDLGRGLYPYQREGVERLLESGRLLLADDMGLGKTTQAVACCHALTRAKVVRRALLVVPAALKPQWAREWRAVSSTPITIVDGSPEERAAIYRAKARGALVIGYEQLLRDLTLVRDWHPELVVLDEAQRIKNWETKSAAAVKSLAPRYRLVLTGTPMENRLSDLASIMDFVDDVALEPKWRLAPLHTIADGDGGRGVAGARNLGVLRARLAPVMLRRVRQEVLAQLPPRTDTRLSVPLTEPQRVEHDELYQPIARLLQQASKRPLRQEEVLRLMQLLARQRMICNGLAQLEFEDIWDGLRTRRPTDATLASLASPKLGTFRALVEDLAITQRRKVVVFSQWRRMLRLADWASRDVLAHAGLRAAFFTGAEPGALRERALVDFHDDPSLAVLYLSDAGGVGLNLQRAANACVQLELPWNPAVMEQRVGRIHRLGQSEPIDVFHLVSEEGIEARIAGLLANKQALFTSLFDGTTDAVLFEQSASFLSAVRSLFGEELRAASETRDEEDDAPLDAPDLDATELDATELDADLELDGGASGRPPPALAADVAADSPASAPPPFRVTRREDGGLSIDVPPAMAQPLAGLLASLADALRAGG